MDSSTPEKDTTMQPNRRFARKLFTTILVVFLMLFCLINAAVLMQLPAWVLEIVETVRSQPPSGDPAVAAVRLAKMQNQAITVAAVFTALMLFLSGALLWIWQRRACLRLGEKPEPAPRPAVAPPPEPKKPQPAAADERVYLHLLSLFQQEGRLMDFLSEDLDAFGDEQIGAAARLVHANCREVLNRTVKPKAIINVEEGASYTVKPGFNPAEIRLTGNVSGEPPFTGVVRHRGWQAGNISLPAFADAAGRRVLNAAEIEIVRP